MRFPLAHNVIRRGSVAHTYGMVRKYPDGKPAVRVAQVVSLTDEQ